MKEILYWIWISRIEGIGSVTWQKLLEKYKKPINIWNLTKEELIKENFLNEKKIEAIINPKYRKNLDAYYNYMKKNNIEIIHIFDKNYPFKLREIYDKPIVLYAKGNVKLLNEFSLAIIGCRENSVYGKKVAQMLGYELGKKDIVTISGLAKGIDGISHSATLKAKGKTIAVIGSGIDNIYPKENIELAKDIIKNEGLIISEYIVGSKPHRMHFPARNRIISGLSNGIVVIEAKRKSGTMITVDFALEQGKEVFAVPGRITDLNSEGTNYIIKQGAKLITKIEDIIEEF